MSEIKEGEYIRTNRGIIAKVIYIREATRYRCTSGTISHSPERYFLDNEQKHSVSIGYVKAHSKNIIDLIEVGDIVGVTFWHEPDSFEKFVYDVKDLSEFKEQIEEQIITIDTILTHEQYEQNCYKVGDIE